jgi:hypothetical protein
VSEEFIFEEVEALRREDQERTGKEDKDITEETEEEANIRNKHTIRHLTLEDHEKHLAGMLMPESNFLTRGAAKLVRGSSRSSRESSPDTSPATAGTCTTARRETGLHTTRTSSLTRLQYSCRNRGELIIAIQDSENKVFGGFITTDLTKNQDFFGTGDTFLFKLSVE